MDGCDTGSEPFVSLHSAPVDGVAVEYEEMLEKQAERAAVAFSEGVHEVEFAERFGHVADHFGAREAGWIQAIEFPHDSFRLTDDPVCRTEARGSFRDVCRAHIAGPRINFAEQLPVQVAQIRQIEWRRVDQDVLERNRRKFGFCIGKGDVIADAEHVAQDGGAGLAIRVVRYAVLVPHAGSGAGRRPVFPEEFGLGRQRTLGVLGDRVSDAFESLAGGEVFPAMLEVPALGEFQLRTFHGGCSAGLGASIARGG